MNGIDLRAPEVEGAVATLSEIDTRAELHDAFSWADLKHSTKAVEGVVQRRVQNGYGPKRAQVFPWPKESGGHRLFSVLDPIDRVVYHAAAGRLCAAVAAAIPGDVPSFELSVGSPGFRWTLTSGRKLHHKRVASGLSNLESGPTRLLTTLDVRDHFGSVDVARLQPVFSDLWLDERSVRAVSEFLVAGAQTHGMRGLPIGHAGSQLLGHASLIPVDAMLRERGVPFVRWVDDYWIFSESAADARTAIAQVAHCLVPLGLGLNDAKTATYEGQEAVAVMKDSSIASAIDRETGGFPIEAAHELFDYAADEPRERAAALRWSLGRLGKRLDSYAAERLLRDPSLLDVSHSHAVQYLSILVANSKTRSSVDVDGLVALAAEPGDQQSEPHRQLAALKVLAKSTIGRTSVLKLREVAMGPVSVSEPIRAWAIRAAQHSNQMPGDAAVNGVLACGGLEARRAFALTLAGHRNGRKLTTWTDRIAREDPDLAPTVTWLRDGAPVP